MTLSEAEVTYSPQDAYRAAHESAVLAFHSEPGVLQLTGRTRLELINRMSTQAVNGLKDGEGAATVLTTEIGRIIDRVIVYEYDDRALLLTGDGHAPALARYLARNIFFNDDVQVKDLSEGMAIFGVYGPRAAELLAEAGFPAAGLPLHHWRTGVQEFIHLPTIPDDAPKPSIEDIGTGQIVYSLHRADPIAGDGFYVMSPPSVAPLLLNWLSLAVPVGIEEELYDYLRIEAGRPRFGRELTLDYIPLEAGLWADVSFSKGCYTGQEIIARMESRGKLAKRLVRLRPASPVAAGAEITANGRPVGTLTSAADGPAGPVALGYVKTAALDEGAELTAAGVPLRVLSSQDE